ncbi:MAG TPA: hypothetical protein VM054_05945 [bacterium]|nr:hypothetical protein [bacterium]
MVAMSQTTVRAFSQVRRPKMSCWGSSILQHGALDPGSAGGV